MANVIPGLCTLANSHWPFGAVARAGELRPGKRPGDAVPLPVENHGVLGELKAQIWPCPMPPFVDTMQIP
jgi:hypothetical protein